MPQFKYDAINKSGKQVSGQMSASNEVELEIKLKDLELEMIECSEQSSSGGFSLRKSSVTDKELILFCMQLEQLEKSGVPLVESLNDIRETAEKQSLRNLMDDIIEEVKNGKILSAALHTHSEVFDEVFVGLVAAGETTGKLDTIFAHLSEHLKWAYEIKNKIKKATTYPLFLIILMGGITSLMMLYVVPKLSNFLLSQNFELPFYTIALIATSNFMQNYWYIVLLGPFILYLVIKISCKMSSGFNFFVDDLFLKIPFFGGLIKKIEISRFCRFFSITFKSGIGILECIDVAGNIVVNAVIKEEIKNIRESISQGSSITNALKLSNQFPSLVIRMVKVGEDGGNLDQTLDNVNYFYDKEVQDSVNKLIGMIQPALTIVMGSFMFWVTAAVFGPLYSSFSKMNF